MDPRSVCARALTAEPVVEQPAEAAKPGLFEPPPMSPYPGDGVSVEAPSVFEHGIAHAVARNAPTQQYVRREELKAAFANKTLTALFDAVAAADAVAEGAAAGSSAAVHAEDMTWLLALEVRCTIANNRSESDETDTHLPGLLAARYAIGSTERPNFVFT